MRSIHCSIVLWICFIGFPVAVSVPTLYGDCWKFCEPDVIPAVSEMESTCVNETEYAANGNGTTNCSYCMFFPKGGCPETTECIGFPPVVTPDGKCLVCPGQECIYNGQAYYVEDTFESIDGSTTCTCNADGRITCDPTTSSTLDVFCSI